jgi:DNA-binding NarL/FixJ family response regulator
MTRILIADDHEVVRAGLRMILEGQPNWEVVAEVADGLDAVRKAAETKPDVAVLDYSLPLLNGIDATRQIRARSPDTEVLIFTMYDNDALIEALLKVGARGYLLKSDANRHLIDAIDALSLHKPFFTAKVAKVLLESLRQRGSRGTSLLTSRESSVLKLIAEGHTNREVSRVLNISSKTVESHRAAVMRKLNLSSFAALVRYAVRNQIVEP